MIIQFFAEDGEIYEGNIHHRGKQWTVEREEEQSQMDLVRDVMRYASLEFEDGESLEVKTKETMDISAG